MKNNGSSASRVDRQSIRRLEGAFVTQQQPTVFDLPKVLAVGLVSPAAAALTSRFGIAGTLLGLVLSAVLITAGVDLLKVYLARVPGAVTTIPGGFRKKSSLRNLLERMKRPFSKLASLPRPRRRSLMVGSLVTAGISCLVGLVLITLLEVGVGKNLSCWVWDNCSTESSPSPSSSDGSTDTQASTLPTILGGVQSVTSSTPQVAPSNPPPQQQQPGSPPSPLTPVAPSQAPPGVPEAETHKKPSPSAQSGQWQGSSEVIEVIEEDQQQAPSSSVPADQQQSPVDQQESSADQQQSPVDQQESLVDQQE